jgi:hypothetical protein
MDTPNQPKSEPNAVVVPGEDYQLVVPDLDSPVIDLLNNTATQELVRVTPSADCYSVAYQSSPTAEWESLAETVSMQEAAKKAAYVQEFDIKVVEDSRTGLGQVYLRPGQGSGLAVQSRDHFPIHLTRSTPDPSRVGNEVLIEAPGERERAIFEKPAFTVKTRTSQTEQWQTIHAIHELVNPSEALAALKNIADIDIWTPDSSSTLSEFVMRPIAPSPAWL